MMDRKMIAITALEDAAFAVRREEIIASRAAGETISNRQHSALLRFPDLSDAADYYVNVRHTFKKVFEDWEEEHDVIRRGAGWAEIGMGEPVTNRVP